MLDGFGADELPYGVFSLPGEQARVGVAVGDRILDLASVFDDPVFREPSLNAFMAQGRETWTATRAAIREVLNIGPEAHWVSASEALLHLPFEVADFVDFNSSLQHATNAGRILRPSDEPVRANWFRMPLGYHGRSGTVMASGGPVVRPHGQYLDERTGEVVVAPTTRLDVEAEIGFVVGTASQPGAPIRTADFSDHAFGAVLLLDWSARDIQAYEYVPLGPFLGKSFATTISAWVLPLEALDDARVPSPVQEPTPAEYLRLEEPWGLDIRLEFSLNGTVLSRPRFDTMYWTPPQQLAHLTLNGARVRPGDLFGSGTVSSDDQCGSFLELTSNGKQPLTLADGSTHGFLADGDQIELRAVAYGRQGSRLRLGQACGTVFAAAPDPGRPA